MTVLCRYEAFGPGAQYRSNGNPLFRLDKKDPLMGWTGCFPRGDSLQRLPRSIRRSSPWIPPLHP